jgi:hypothetical protein
MIIAKILFERLIIESLLDEAKYNDLFEFLNQPIKKMTVGTAYYVASMDSSMNKNLVTPTGKILNPMYGKIFKHTRFIFRWQDTYNKAMERTNPEYQFGKRSGTYEKVDGYDLLERKNDVLYLPIIPTGSEYKLITIDGNEISREEAKKYLKPGTPSVSNSGVEYRLLMINKIAKLTGGGNEWINPDFSQNYKGIGKI